MKKGRNVSMKIEFICFKAVVFLKTKKDTGYLAEGESPRVGSPLTSQHLGIPNMSCHNFVLRIQTPMLPIAIKETQHFFS